MKANTAIKRQQLNTAFPLATPWQLFEQLLVSGQSEFVAGFTIRWPQLAEGFRGKP